MTISHLAKLSLAAALLFAACNASNSITGNEDDGDENQPSLEAGTSSFTFSGTPGSQSRPVTVHYHVPTGLTKNSPIVIVMHGNGRNATSYLNAWIPYANSKKFLLVVPEFTSALYSSSRYHYGNVLTSGGSAVDSTFWTYVTVEAIFDEIKKRSGLEREKYYIYGHSAGGQFVHRMVIMMPGARYEEAIAANAGWYVIPDNDDVWPAGLLGVPSTMTLGTRLGKIFDRKLIVMLGTADTSTTDPDLPTRAEAMAQGKHRFERGHFFYDKAKSIAQSRGLPFKWELAEVPGVAHSNSGMAKAAANKFSY